MHGPLCQKFHGVEKQDDELGHLKAGAGDDTPPPPPPPRRENPVGARHNRADDGVDEVSGEEASECPEGNAEVFGQDETGFRGPLQLIYGFDEEGAYLTSGNTNDK